jgi:hypothetical protein
MKSVDLGHGVVLRIHSSTYVETVYPDGLVAGAGREPTYDNLQEMADEGYTDLHVCLVEHEILHTLLSRIVFGTESPVLREQAGAGRARYAIRLYEEALVISYQTWIKTGRRDPILTNDFAEVVVLLNELREDIWREEHGPSHRPSPV